MEAYVYESFNNNHINTWKHTFKSPLTTIIKTLSLLCLKWIKQKGTNYMEMELKKDLISWKHISELKEHDTRLCWGSIKALLRLYDGSITALLRLCYSSESKYGTLRSVIFQNYKNAAPCSSSSRASIERIVPYARYVSCNSGICVSPRSCRASVTGFSDA